jgi:hypothetical protein
MLYTGAARSLFDEDKLPFAVLMLARYMLVGIMRTCSSHPVSGLGASMSLTAVVWHEDSQHNSEM